jgi:hypothetical protein
MDIASKIKAMKQEIQSIDDMKAAIEGRIKELKELVALKIQKAAKLAELEKQEAELMSQL